MRNNIDLSGDNFEDIDIQSVLDNLADYTPDELAEINVLVDELSARDRNSKAYDDLLVYFLPGVVSGSKSEQESDDGVPHHRPCGGFWA